MNHIATHRLQAATSFLPAVIFFILLLTGSTVAQTTTSSATDMKTPAALTPGAPAGSYALSDFDNVNLYNGNLNFRLPLVKVGGRGAAGYTVMLALNSKRWRIRYTSTTVQREEVFRTWTPTTNHWNGPEVGYSAGVLIGRQVGVYELIDRRRPVDPSTCNPVERIYKFTLTRLVFTTPDGTEYELRDQATNGQPQQVPQSACHNPSAPGFARGRVFITADGSSVSFISDSVIYDTNTIHPQGARFIHPTGYLLMPDGVRYRIENGRVTWIRDRNGNKVTVGASGAMDSLGRRVNIYQRVEDVAPYGLCDKIVFKGANGEERVIRVSRDRLSNALRAGYSIQTHTQLFPGLNGAHNIIPNTFDPPDLVSSVWLPDGRRYRLFYNPYGELARVELPTGGAFEYDYTPGSGVLTGPGPSGDDLQIYRRVVERRAYSDGATLTGKMLYSTGGITYKDANGVTLSSEGNSYISSSFAQDSLFWPDNMRIYGDWTEGRVNRSAVGGAMRITTTNWQQRAPVSWLSWWNSLDRGPGYPNDNPANDPRAVETITTLNDTNQVSKTTSINPSTGAIHFDDYNNPLDVWEYGFGTGASGALLRHTHIDYLTAGYDTIAGGAANPDPNDTIHIRNLPLQKQVFDAGGTKRAETFYEYDNYNSDGLHAPLSDCPNISGHDGAFSTGRLKRGNITKTSRALLDNNGSVTGWVNSHAQYDIAGNVVKVIDSNEKATQFDFRDNFGSPDDPSVQSSENPANNAPGELDGQMSYAFPFKITNALGHKTYTKYDYYLGSAALSEDVNGVKSNIYFNDALDRPTRGVRAIGTSVASQTVIVYNDSDSPVNGHPARSITTISDKDVFGESNSGNGLKSVALYDGLGRTWRVASYEGSTWSITDTHFDALSRVSQVSNPYRAADPGSASPPSGPWAEWTTTDYDALGRVIRVTTPDDAHVDTAYSGNQVTVTDPAVKSRRSETDALGRLIKITEAQGELNYETFYSYDALGNLRLVTQGTQTRTFVYDSLSRLISATNPESGTMTYAYDPSGNLIEKTDARGVKTTMTYDALNRVRSKVYAGITLEGTAAANATPPVNYFYDDYSGLPSGAPSWPGTPSKGRLIGVKYGPGSEGSYYKYDAAGRIVTNHQRQGTSNYATTYFYNRAGAATREDRGSPARRRNWMYYDEAGRLLAMQSGIFNAFGFEPRDLVNNISYTPFGGLQSERYGNELVHSMTYNSRHQPTEIRLGRPDNLESVFRIGYIFGTANNVNGQDAEITAAHNNGNVARIKYLISGTVQYTQTFQYDPLNRLSYAVEHNNGIYNDSSRAWYQTFDYDRYGNRGINVTGTSDNVDAANSALQLAEFSASNNRITRDGLFYDASGNLIAEPGKSYTYDAENRIVMATVAGGATSQYFYDGNGRRVKKIVGGMATRFEYGAGGQLIAEWNDADSPNRLVQKDYFYKGGELLATSKVGNSGQYEYATSDHLGTPRAWTGPDGNLIAGGRHDYCPFGEELSAGVGIRSASLSYDEDLVRQKFTSKERDAETGLDYFLARYYSSIQGRFTSVDPENVGTRVTDPQSWNAYAYALNNPLVYGDPDGLKVQVCYGEGDDKQCNTYSDKQFADAKKSLQDAGFTVKDGKIINDEGNQVGTFTKLSDDSLSPLANGLLYGPQSLGARADGMKGLIGLHAAAGVAGGTGVGVGLAAAGGGAGVTTLGNGIGIVARLRTIFDIGAKRTIAYATYEIEGTSGSLVSASGQAARQGLSNAANTLFGTLREGVRSRAFDAEVKILEQIGNGLTTNPTARGVINIFVERPPCPSCVGVINQFRATFPSIEVIVKTIPFRF